jgi:O-antigen/teichoic acid export membrane protein
MVGQSVVQKAVGFLTTMALSQMLHSHGLGLFGVTNSTAGSLYGVIRLGVDAGVHVLTAETDPIKDADLVSEILSHALIILLAVGSGGGIVCYVLADRIAADLFGDPVLRTFIEWAALLLFVQVLGQFAYIAFAGLHAFTVYARISIVTAPVLASLTIAGAYMSGATGATVGLVVGQVLAVIALLLALSKVCRDRNIRFIGRLRLRRIRSILAIGFPFYAAGLLGIPVEYMLQALVVRGHGVAMIGDLRVIVAITSIMSFIPTAIAGPMVSALTRARTESAARYWQLVVWNSKVLWFFSTLVVSGIGVLWGEIIRLGFGDTYREAAAFGYLALMSSSFSVLLGIVNASSFATKGTMTVFWLGTGTAVIFFSIAVVAVPQYGLPGYLIAQLISQFVAILFVLILLVIRDEQGGNNFRWTIPAAVVTAAVFGSVIWSNRMPWGLIQQAVMAFATTALAALAGAVWVFGRAAINDLFQQIRLEMGLKP